VARGESFRMIAARVGYAHTRVSQEVARNGRREGVRLSAAPQLFGWIANGPRGRATSPIFLGCYRIAGPPSRLRVRCGWSAAVSAP